jgi:uncharacterized membrane-anchored protein
MVENAIKNRVPHIILLYWVIKIASTTLGETGADMFSMTYGLGYGATIIIFMSLFLAFLALKLFVKKYEPITYWLTFTATAIVGTALSDYIDRTLGLGYLLGSVVLIGLLCAALFLWYLHDKTINVEYIDNRTSEIYYWVAFLIANTLGTAAGDFLADELELGFATSAVIISSSLIVITLLHFYTKISGVLLFWLAFVLTRPFGATFGDLLTKTDEYGGLDVGTVGSSALFATVLVLAIMREMQVERKKKINEFD